MTARLPYTIAEGDTSNADKIQANFEFLINMLHPIGSIYLSTVSTNPGTLFGFGTWVAWGTGMVPVGVDTGQTEFNTVEKTGGAKTHTLQTTEIPAHSHKFGYETGSTTSTGSPYATSRTMGHNPGNQYSDTSNTGGGGAHNNLQPYITCYMWKRTA